MWRRRAGKRKSSAFSENGDSTPLLSALLLQDGKLRIRHQGGVVAEIPNRALADEAPKYDRPHNVKPHRRAPVDPPSTLPSSTDLAADLLRLVASPDLCSKRWIWEQYDYMVRTNTIVGPGSGRRRHSRKGNRHVHRDVARWKRPLLLPGSEGRRKTCSC